MNPAWITDSVEEGRGTLHTADGGPRDVRGESGALAGVRSNSDTLPSTTVAKTTPEVIPQSIVPPAAARMVRQSLHVDSS
jgi:hypothetical protein